MKTRKPTVVVFLEGGGVSRLITNDERIDLITVDFDVDGCDFKQLKMDSKGQYCVINEGGNEAEVKPEEVRYWRKKLQRQRRKSAL